MSTPQNQQSVAAANAVSGQRTFAQVEFPVTGDTEADLISAVVLVCYKLRITRPDSARVMEYLQKRFLAEWEAMKPNMPTSRPTPEEWWKAISSDASIDDVTIQALKNSPDIKR